MLTSLPPLDRAGPAATEPAPQDPTTGPIGLIDYHERIVLPPRPQPASSAATGTRLAPATEVSPARPLRGGLLVLAALQLVVGYQWLVSGIDKLLYAGFPDQLGQLISGVASSDRVPAFFVTFLRTVVLPNSVAFGVAIEYGETLTGIGLLGGALLTLSAPALRRSAIGARHPVVIRTLAVLSGLTIVAAFGSLTMGLTYYLLDGMPLPWFQPGLAYGGAIDSALFLALSSVVILLGRVTVREARR